MVDLKMVMGSEAMWRCCCRAHFGGSDPFTIPQGQRPIFETFAYLCYREVRARFWIIDDDGTVSFALDSLILQWNVI